MRHTRGSALCALVAAAVLAPAASADEPPAAPPCAAAGLVAIVQPTATAAVPLGPAVEAATTQGAAAASFHDAQYAVDLTDAESGAAGCVGGGAAPGGTHAAAAAWSLLGALAGTALRADLVPAPGDGSGWRLRANVQGLRVAGVAAEAARGTSLPVGDWGTLTVGAQVDLPRLAPLRYWAAALELRLSRAHAGLPAGTLVLVGYAAASRPPAPPPAPTATTPTTTAATTTSRPAATPTTTAPTPATTAPAPTRAKAKRAPARHRTAKRAKAKPHRKRPHVARQPHPRTGQPLDGTPPLRLSGYVFPVAGGADWGDTYGAARSDVPGGWHHGDDLFASLGTPVVAVADGTVFAVGWNETGGWRLWLADAAGNAFYYAHLSGYTKLAHDDAEVRRGEVLGFIGNTGDAFTTPPHLHFEVHPNPLLYLGYDGAVDPTSYLRAWPLAGHVHVLPPAPLPGGAPAGFGSATDFRRLLAVHPQPTRTHAAQRPAPAAPSLPSRHSDLVGAPALATHHGGADSSIPIALGVVLLACGLAAVVHAARDGRT